jgi:hypothetical protein
VSVRTHAAPTPEVADALGFGDEVVDLASVLAPVHS